MQPSNIVAVGITHKIASLPERERFALPPAGAQALLAEMAGEALLLVTCNRTELYAVGEAEGAVRALRYAAGDAAGTPLFTLHEAAAVRHLFEVAAGLDSMVLGEPQILGQVKRAMAAAREAVVLGPVLDHLCRRAMTVGRRVRRETELGKGLPSIPKVATGMARLVLGDLSGRRLLIVGTGKLGGLTGRALRGSGATTVVVVNRTLGPATALAAEIGGHAQPFDRLDQLLIEADIVITCTASQEPVLTQQRVGAAVAAREGRPLVLIDIAVPRDVEAGVREIAGARLYDLDDLRGWGSAAVSPRAIADAQAIVDAETREFLAWHAGRAAVPTIRALQERADTILDAELERVSSAEAEAMRAFGRRVVAKLLHHPMTRLRERVATEGEPYLSVARDLFALERDNGDGHSE